MEKQQRLCIRAETLTEQAKWFATRASDGFGSPARASTVLSAIRFTTSPTSSAGLVSASNVVPTAGLRRPCWAVVITAERPTPGISRAVAARISSRIARCRASAELGRARMRSSSWMARRTSDRPTANVSSQIAMTSCGLRFARFGTSTLSNVLSRSFSCSAAGRGVLGVRSGVPGLGEIRLVGTIDRVHRVVHRTLHHREAQGRDGAGCPAVMTIAVEA